MIHNTYQTYQLLALQLPGGSTIDSPVSKITDLGGFVSGLLSIAFYVAAFLAFYFLVWGAFQYIMAQGDKEGLGKAKARITYAIIGLFVILLAYFIATFAFEIFKPTKGVLPF